MREHFHQFSPLRMEEIRNDYTRDCEIRRGGGIPFDFAIWIDEWRAVFGRETGSYRSGTGGKRNRGDSGREIRFLAKSRLRNLGRDLVHPHRFRFVSKNFRTLGKRGRNNFSDLSIDTINKLRFSKKRGGRSTLEDGRNSRRWRNNTGSLRDN